MAEICSSSFHGAASAFTRVQHVLPLRVLHVLNHGATWILIPEATVDSCCSVVSFINSAKSYLSSSMLACLNPGLGTDAETLVQYGGPLGW